jgi:alkaline phosphatase
MKEGYIIERKCTVSPYTVVLLLTSILFCRPASAQKFDASNIFAHNDYEKPDPFYTAYGRQVGYIEADIHLVDGKLLVAHDTATLSAAKTLAALYLEPLKNKIAENAGHVYPDAGRSLALMIDLKTDAGATLGALARLLKKYPLIIKCKTLNITVSGNMPPPDQWTSYPTFIKFDGRPGIVYTDKQLARITLISASFKSYTQWNGNGSLPKEDRDKITEVIRSAHQKNKPFRFWATPDFANAWMKMMDLDVDVLNTDNVTQLSDFLSQLPTR